MKKQIKLIIDRCVNKIEIVWYMIKVDYYHYQVKKSADIIEYYKSNFDSETQDEMVEWAVERLDVYLEKECMAINKTMERVFKRTLSFYIREVYTLLYDKIIKHIYEGDKAMATVYMITELIKKVEDEKRGCIKELNNLEKSETFFKRTTESKNVCKAKIEILNKVDRWLKEELRKTVLMDNMEL